MSYLSVILIAVIEAMDCFAVATSIGLGRSGVSRLKATVLALSFGFFQGGMTLIGFFSGTLAKHWIHDLGSIIACAILCLLGAKFILEAFRKKEDEHKIANLSLASIVILSLATSIDALTIGVSFAFVEIDMVFATIAISLAAILFGILGFEIGNRAARFFKSNLPQIIAGIILIAIGIKTIWQPLMT
ncbi:MAG: manganese efflux pump [Fibrobacter sp.]|nr:manganese efflux pump [Fibrobacter sp.]